MRREKEDIIIRPILSEKSIRQKKKMNKVSFRVVKDANKSEIKKAIERLFSVSVKAVNTAIRPGKKRRAGYKARVAGKLPDWKKAIVTLAPGDKIDVFEGT